MLLALEAGFGDLEAPIDDMVGSFGGLGAVVRCRPPPRWSRRESIQQVPRSSPAGAIAQRVAQREILRVS